MTDHDATPHDTDNAPDDRPAGGPAEPDSLVALVPIAWDPNELELLEAVHPDVWGEPLKQLEHSSTARFVQVGGCDAPIRLDVDEPIAELAEMTATAKQPFTPAEAIQLENHTAIWRFTMADVSKAPTERAHAFGRLMASAVEAGAPGVFFPFCVQLHSPRLIKHLAFDLSQPPALINLYVNAWNDDEWMVTRGMTVFGLPELETPVEGGLNNAYFRLMDVAAGMLLQRDAYPDGSRLQLGPHHYIVEQGPRGPQDSMVPISGVYGRLTIAPAT
jgi:hypothetical protein